MKEKNWINQSFKTAIAFLLAAGSVSHGLYAQDLTEHKVNLINIPSTASPPKIDGILEGEFWDKAKFVDGFRLTSGAIGELAKERTECYLAYDDETLYIAFRCYESDMANIKDDCREWDDLAILDDDHVAVFLDTYHNHRNYFELAVNPSAVQMDRSGFSRYRNVRTADWDIDANGFWKARTQLNEDNWTVEIAIKMNTFGMDSAKDGSTIGFNLARVRQPDFESKGGKVEEPVGNCETSAWRLVQDGIWETPSDFYEPNMFGDLTFGTADIDVTDIRFKTAKFNWGDSYTPSTFGRNPIEIRIDPVNSALDEVMLNMTVESETAATWESSEKFMLSIDAPIKTEYFINENRESKLTLQLVDPANDRPLYNYSYFITTPPFIEFDLEPLYQRDMPNFRPIGYRLNMDDKTMAGSHLKLSLYHQKTMRPIAEETLTDLEKTTEFIPIFDTRKLRELEGGNYVIVCELIDKTTFESIGSFDQNFTKFDLNTPEKFGAIEGEYSFSGISDHAIRIQYPEGHEFVFWAAANYNPWWDIDQAALNHEHLETWGGGVQGCAEVMQDRERRYSEVWLVENSHARVVVKWRYALADAHYNIHQNEWGEELYTFFPDGTGIREVNLWANSTKSHEFMEVIPVKPGGVLSLQMYEDPIASLTTLDGKGYGTDVLWNESEEFYKNFLRSADDFVVDFNLRDRRNPYVIFSVRDDLFPGVSTETIDVCSPRKNLANADERGHWPVSLYAIDGYNSIGTDRPRHGNIGSIKASTVDYDNQKNRWTMFLGTEKENGEDRYLHGKSWLYPAEIYNTGPGMTTEGYDPQQRAYILSVQEGTGQIGFDMKAGNPILNPVFVLKENRKIAKVTANSKPLDPDKVKVGYSKRGETIVFLDARLKKMVSLGFEFDEQ